MLIKNKKASETINTENLKVEKSPTNFFAFIGKIVTKEKLTNNDKKYIPFSIFLAVLITSLLIWGFKKSIPKDI